jgi:hypothetical protein
MTDQVPIPSVNVYESKESITLTKNTKGYQWEIKILSLDVNKLVDLDKQLREKFGVLQ